ncbi:DUF1294 domain-containing protein [Paenibacillus lycopersici]|uniref:DUF1294 domain-containing protein n=1 Tax=Paenibacillus lycopersici TaxID=2704462 RepID=A0A6C0FUF4_9BACL|nr:DUF1294 domain-containing protein [Paenibacillus lycopersici]QHT60786.1 DUF1294 domain-containing protein [Paenibacillus lycopersici]
MSSIEKLVLIYLIVINLVAWALMRIDKIRAVKDRRHRIPERRLLWTSALGGALGAFIAMRMFHHKTKHPAFAAGIPVMLLAHIAIMVWLEYK